MSRNHLFFELSSKMKFKSYRGTKLKQFIVSDLTPAVDTRLQGVNKVFPKGISNGFFRPNGVG